MTQLPGKGALGRGSVYASSTPHLVLTLGRKVRALCTSFPGFGKK